MFNSRFGQQKACRPQPDQARPPKRETPDVLELSELQLLLSMLSVRERTLALLDAATGLRVSELLALRWSDVDFESLELNITRSIWHQVVGNCKTEASAKPVPMDSYMAEDLLRWRRQSPLAAWIVRAPTPYQTQSSTSYHPIRSGSRGPGSSASGLCLRRRTCASISTRTRPRKNASETIARLILSMEFIEFEIARVASCQVNTLL